MRPTLRPKNRLSFYAVLCLMVCLMVCQTMLASTAHAGATTDALPAPITELIRQARFKEEELAFFVQAVDQDEPVIARRAEQMVMLASTTKIPTTLAALDLLGSKFRWRTQVFARGSMQDGVLAGNLEIVGGGDPSLDAEGLKQLMTKLRKRGLQRIQGDIIVNRLAFRLNDKDHLQTPIPNADRVHHVRPDALIVNQNMISIDFEPTPGDASRTFKVQASPALFGIEIVNRMVGLSGPCLRQKSTLDFTLDAEPVTAASPPARRLLTLVGSYPLECGARRWEIAPLSAAEFTRLALHQAWLDAGGLLDGKVVDLEPPPLRTKPVRTARQSRGKAPRPFVVQESAAMTEVIDEVNKWSNNVLARHLFLSLSSGFPTRSATLLEARKSMQAWLQTQGISADAMQLDNGSGLSRDERATPAALGKLLVNAWRNNPLREGFLGSLPVVGIDGTMGNRLKQSAAAGKAFIKTGTLTGVRAVAGYVTGASGKTYALVAVANSANAHLAQLIHDRLIEWIYVNG